MHNLVHQVDQVAVSVSLLVLLSKLLDDLVDELAEGLRVLGACIAALVDQLEELTQVFFAVTVGVGQVDQAECADKYLQTLVDGLFMHLLMEEEFFEDTDGRQTEVPVAKSHQEMVFHASEDMEPLFLVRARDIGLSASIEDLDVRPLEALQVLLLDNFLEGLAHVESVPLLRSAISSILLRVGARDVDLLLCSREWVHLESG